MKDLTTELMNFLHEAELLRESQLVRKFLFFYETNTSLRNASLTNTSLTNAISSRLSAVHTLTVYFYKQSF